MPSLAKVAALLPVFTSFALASSQPSGVLQMKAATKRSELLRRDRPIRQSFETELTYADVENAHGVTDTFFSKVKFGSDIPVLALEDIEHHLEDVMCDGSRIYVDLRTAEARDTLREACEHEEGSYLITSHASCNREGERTAYRVHHESTDERTNGLIFTAAKVPFDKAFSSMKLEFGHSKEAHAFRDDIAVLRRRQDGPAAPFPLPGNDGTPGVSIDLNNQVLDTVLTLPEVVTALLPVQIPVEIRCVECSTSGTLDITAGEFEMDLSVFDGDGIDLIQSGNIVMTGNGIGARLELAATPSVGFSTEIPLPSIPIPALGFAIPGIGEAGVTFQPEISMSFEVSGGIEFTYGLTASIPDGSTITIDFADFGNSGVTGFTDPTVEALPFQANVTAVEMTLATGFRPRLTLGFEFIESVTAEVGLFADLPSLSATFSTQSNVDQNCNPLPADAAPADAADAIAAALGDFTLIDFGIGVAVGVEAQLAAPVIPDFETALTIAQTTFQLATTCLAADPAGETGLVPAAPLVSSMVEAGEVASWVAELPDVPPETPLAPAYTPPAMTPHALPPMPKVAETAVVPVAPAYPQNTSKPEHIYQVEVEAPAATAAAAVVEEGKPPSRVMRAMV